MELNTNSTQFQSPEQTDHTPRFRGKQTVIYKGLVIRVRRIGPTFYRLICDSKTGAELDRDYYDETGGFKSVQEAIDRAIYIIDAGLLSRPGE